MAILSACSLAVLAWVALVSPVPRLTYNPTNSVAAGWYRIEPVNDFANAPPRSLAVDRIVLVPLPAEVVALAARRGYLPMRVPLLKRVGAVAPQEVCIAGSVVRIDGVSVATVLPVDRQGRSLPSWQHCRRLETGELFLLSFTDPASFDSRYFGPVRASAVLGVAHPIWTETRA